MIAPIIILATLVIFTAWDSNETSTRASGERAAKSSRPNSTPAQKSAESDVAP